MPKVGGEEYEYTAEGIKAAEERAEATGEKVVTEYNAGGRVKKIKGYYGGGMVADYMGGYSPSNITGLSSIEAGRKNLAMKDGGNVKEEE